MICSTSNLDLKDLVVLLVLGATKKMIFSIASWALRAVILFAHRHAK